MPGELMLVNPRSRKRRGARRMTAKQLKYFGPGRKRRRRRTRTVLAVNPRRRHRRASRRLAINPRRHRRRRMSVRRYRRNPIGMGGFSLNSFLSSTVMPAGVGAMGALGTDIALAYGAPYLPAMLTSGIGLVAARLAGAIGVGMLAGKAMGRRYGEQATAGAVTVILYDTLKTFVQANVPQVPLSGYNMGWISPAIQTGAMNGMGVYVGQDQAYSGMAGMGMYVGERESDYYKAY